MTSAERMALMQERLEKVFSPESLQIEDDSAQHAGHAGSKGGAGHYTVEIAAAAFQGKSRIMIHREIYAVLDDLMPQEIHALIIKARAIP